MNFAYTEIPLATVSNTCGDCKEDGEENNKKKVTYTFVDTDCPTSKKDIISAEWKACMRLLRYTQNKNDRKIIRNEIAQLKMTLDLLPEISEFA